MTQLTYRLPLSYLRITGTAKYITDPFASPGEEVSEPQAQVELLIIGDESHPRIIELEEKRWRDGTASLEFTEDGRLTSASREVVGQGGKALTGLVSVITSVAGAAVAIAGRGVAPMFATNADAPDEAGVDALEQFSTEKAAKDALSNRLSEEYAKAHPRQAGLRTQLIDISASLREAIAASLIRIRDAQDPPVRREAQRELQARKSALKATTPELELLNAHYAAWRAGTQKTREEDHAYQVTLDELRTAKVTIKDGSVQFPVPGEGDNTTKMKAAQAEIRAAWDNLGVLVIVDDARRRVLSDQVRPMPAAASRGVVIRIPRTVTLRVYAKEADGKPVLKSTHPVSILDSLSDHQELVVSAGVFGEGKGHLAFSDAGTLAKVEAGSKSGAAAAAEALGTIPSTVASSLETTNKIADQFGALRGKQTELALSRAKAEHDLKQKQLDLAGLAATEEDYAELQRLTQELTMLQKQKEIGAFAPSTPDATALEIANLKQEIELLKARRQVERLRGQEEPG